MLRQISQNLSKSRIGQRLDDININYNNQQTDICYQKDVLSGDAEKTLGLENCFIHMTRKAVF